MCPWGARPKGKHPTRWSVATLWTVGMIDAGFPETPNFCAGRRRFGLVWSIISYSSGTIPNWEEEVMSLTLMTVGISGDVIELTYEETDGDPQPFVLTVTSHYISRQTSKSPIEASDLEAFVLMHATELRRAAEECRAKGLNFEVLK